MICYEYADMEVSKYRGYPYNQLRLATAYVPVQNFGTLLQPVEALIKGTAFPDLVSPYRKREYVNMEPEVSATCNGRGDCCEQR